MNNQENLIKNSLALKELELELELYYSILSYSKETIQYIMNMKDISFITIIDDFTLKIINKLKEVSKNIDIHTNDIAF